MAKDFCSPIPSQQFKKARERYEAAYPDEDPLTAIEAEVDPLYQDAFWSMWVENSYYDLHMRVPGEEHEKGNKVLILACFLQLERQLEALRL